MLRRTLAAVIAASAIAAPTARADGLATISGSPLTVYLGDRGQLQAIRAGETHGFFYKDNLQFGDAGFFLAFPGAQPAGIGGSVFGFDGTAGPDGLELYTPVPPQSAVTGAGTPASPFQQVTKYDVVGTGATIVASVTQTATYVNGEQQFNLQWDVLNRSGGALHFKALAAADFFFEGSDRGTGIFTQGPPRFIGGTNADTGRSGGFVEVGGGATPWSRYQALEFAGDPTVPDVWSDKIEHAGDSTDPTFDNTVAGQPLDNAGGVEWDGMATGAGLAAGATATYKLTVRSALPAALQFDKSNAGAPQGTPITFVATAVDTSGTPYSGRPLRFSITGANALNGAATIDAAGHAGITDPGTNAGADTVVAYVDLNNDGVREAAEPQASTLATFVDNIPPACTVKVSGDRPGGGGAGKPLVISVNCNSPATVTTQTTLAIAPSRARAAAKPKKVTVKLPAATAQVLQAGKPLAISIKVPKKIAKKYAGAKVVAKVTVTAADAAGNKASTTATRTLKLAVVKKKRHRR